MVLYYIGAPKRNGLLFILWNIFFWTGIVFNGLWTYFYFQKQNEVASYVLFLFLILFAAATNVLTIFSKEKYKWITFTLFIPYLLWLIFAFYYFVNLKNEKT
jgi:tryptophan-rich sensory protein